MQNGIYEKDSGTFYRLESRSDLKSQKIQEVLDRNHHTKNLACGCGLKEGIFHLVLPRLLSFAPNQDRAYTAVRCDIDEHAFGCFLTKDSDDTESVYQRTSQILGPIPELVVKKSISTQEAYSHRASYESFSEYARQIFSSGVTNAYLLRNNGRSRHTNPTAAEVFSSIDQSIRGYSFKDGYDGYTTAENEWACRLRFGLVFDPVMVEGEPKTLLNVWWWNKSGSYGLGLVRARTEAMAPAVAALKIFGEYRTPPYFVFAVQDEHQCLQRVYFHKVLVGENYLIPVDSSYEAAFADKLIQNGAAIIKPVCLAHTESLLTTLGFPLDAGMIWPYRPDFLIIWPGKSGTTLQIREVRGFKKGKLPDYDRLMGRKPPAYESLKSTCPLVYEEVEGYKLPSPLDPIGLEEWTSIKGHLEISANPVEN